MLVLVLVAFGNVVPVTVRVEVLLDVVHDPIVVEIVAIVIIYLLFLLLQL